MTHRGYTHTVWFALFVGAGCGVAVTWLPVPTVLPPRTDLAAFCTAVGTTTTCSHVVADGLTPAGVRPFAPFGERRTLGLVRGSNRIANLLVLVLGVGVLTGALRLAATPG